MEIKEGAILIGLDIKMRPALILADEIWNELGQELVVTSGLDGTHSSGSLHYYGLALDFRVRYFEDDGDAAFRLLKVGLGDDFDVILHNSHIHVEYQPKETETPPESSYTPLSDIFDNSLYCKTVLQNVA